MHVLMTVFGSSGDIHPYLAIGQTLQQRGHRVTILTNPLHESLVRDNGFRYVPSGTAEEFIAAISHPDHWNPRAAFPRVWQDEIKPHLQRTFDHIVAELDDETVLLSSQLSCFATRLVQDKLGVPLVTAWVSPLQFFSARMPPTIKGLPLLRPEMPYPLKALLLWVLDRVIMDGIGKKDFNRLRKRLGLAPVSSVMRRWIHSPQKTLGLYPAWLSPPQKDWPANAQLSGFPLFDVTRWHPLDDETERFLAAGPAPVVVTTGTAMHNVRDYFEAAVAALQRLGRRGILLTATAENVPSLPAGFMRRASLPLHAVLPRAAAFVHHGGIGTIAQACAAGVPQLVIPAAMDQIDNASRLARTGCALHLQAPLKAHDLERTLQKLLNSDAIRQRCADIRAQMDDGPTACAKTADIIEQVGRKYLRKKAPAASTRRESKRTGNIELAAAISELQANL